MNKENVMLLFDLDGTISDPLHGIARSINYALTSLGYESWSASDLAQFVGPPLDETFKALTGLPDENGLNSLIAKFRERYADIGYSENELYPGVKQAIRDLSSRNVPMAVCTSKRRDFAEKILSFFDMHHYFEFVSGGDVGVHKWRQIESLLARRSIDHNAIMVGDRAVDLVAAHTNGIKSAGVLWGFGSYAELNAHSPAYLLSRPSQLLGLLA